MIAIPNSVLSLAVYLRLIVPLYRSPLGATNAPWPVLLVGASALALALGVGRAVELLVRRLA